MGVNVAPQSGHGRGLRDNGFDQVHGGSLARIFHRDHIFASPFQRRSHPSWSSPFLYRAEILDTQCIPAAGA
jgi:hypothetical protein